MTLKGTLKVTVVEAKNLKDEDFIGKSDPYVKLTLDKEKNIQTTKPKSGDLNPKFDETFTFNVDGQKELRVEVLDKDPGKDDEIGSATIKLSDFATGNYDNWVKIKQHIIGRSKGEVHLRAQFSSAAA